MAALKRYDGKRWVVVDDPLAYIKANPKDCEACLWLIYEVERLRERLKAEERPSGKAPRL